MTSISSALERGGGRRRRSTRLAFIALSTALAVVASSAVALPAIAESTPSGSGVAAWGRSGDGEVTTPADLGDIVAVAAGDDHDLALRSDGTVVAWGDNSVEEATVPTGLTDVVAISAAMDTSLALRRDGTIVGWGWGAYGMPENLFDVVGVSAGDLHTLAVSGDGTVSAWGSDYFGQVSVPSGLTDVVAVAAGMYHSLALRRDGTVVAWGQNTYGQTTVPAGLTDVTAISAGRAHSLALRSDGTVVAWGWDGWGQTDVPAGLVDVVAISAGQDFSLALRRDGTVVSWGVEDPWGDHPGEAGVPAELSGATAISAGHTHSLAVGARPTLTADAPPVVATVGADYTYTFDALDEQTFSVTSGELPAGLTLGADGTISGTPAVAGTFTFTVSAENLFGSVSGSSHTITVSSPVAASVSGVPGNGAVGETYDFAYTVAGTPAPVVTLGAGKLPRGLSMDTSGRVTGTPTAVGSYTFTVQAANASNAAQVTSTIVIGAAPTIRGNPADGTVGVRWNYRYAVTGEPRPAVSLQSGTLPPGLALESSGRLSGYPLVAGTYTFTLQASNMYGTAQTEDTITIAPTPVAPSINGDATPGAIHSPYDFTYTVTGTPDPVVTLASGTLPDGLTLDSAGHLTGTPTVAGRYSFTVQAHNSAGTGYVSNTIIVTSDEEPAGAAGLPTNGKVGSAYEFDYDLWGRPAPTVQLRAGTLPPGLTLSSDGHLRGTPTTAGSYEFILEASNPLSSVTWPNVIEIAPTPVSFGSEAPWYGRIGGSFTPVIVAGPSSAPPILTASGSCSLGEGGLVSYDSVGTCTLTLDQAGDSTYPAASSAVQSFEVYKAIQNLAFTSTAPAAAVAGGAPYTPTVRPGESTAPVELSSETPEVCSISDGIVSFLAAGDCSLALYQAEDATYQRGEDYQQFTVAAAPKPTKSQTIQFTTAMPSSPDTGIEYPVAAQATSGLPVTFVSSGPCTLTPTGPGTATVRLQGSSLCTVRARQSGDSTWRAAGSRSQTIQRQPGTRADLTIGLALTPQLPADAPLSGTVTVKNVGDRDAGLTTTRVTVNGIVASAPGAVQTPGMSPGTTVLTWTEPRVAPGQSIDYTVAFTNRPASTTITATVSMARTDPTPANNTVKRTIR